MLEDCGALTGSQIPVFHEQSPAASDHLEISPAPFHAASDPYGHVRMSFLSLKRGHDHVECVCCRPLDYLTMLPEWMHFEPA